MRRTCWHARLCPLGMAMPEVGAPSQSQTAPASAAVATPLLGIGQVWHQRLRPRVNAFHYGSYFLLLPMRAWATAQAQPSGPAGDLARNRFGLISFHDRDHGLGGGDALAWLDDVLRSQGITDAQGEVWLQTLPRVLGYAFKPVSFWFAQRTDGSLAAVLVEVNNTFGERHCYLLEGSRLGWGREAQASKVFHVSPFCSISGHYRFRFERSLDEQGEWSRLLARIDLHDEHGTLIQTSVGGRLGACTAAAMRQAFFGLPLMTLGVIFRIHWQALRLALKRVPFFRKPPAPEHFVSR